MIGRFLGYFLIILTAVMLAAGIPLVSVVILAGSILTGNNNIDLVLVVCIVLVVFGSMVVLSFAIGQWLAEKFDL